MGRTTKIRFTATIEMDVDEWANAYGMDATKIRQIQDDVRNAVVTAIYAMEISPNAVDVR